MSDFAARYVEGDPPSFLGSISAGRCLQKQAPGAPSSMQVAKPMLHTLPLPRGTFTICCLTVPCHRETHGTHPASELYNGPLLLEGIPAIIAVLQDRQTGGPTHNDPSRSHCFDHKGPTEANCQLQWTVTTASRERGSPTDCPPTANGVHCKGEPGTRQ